MKSFSSNPPKDFALLIVGRSGSGKSTLAGRFPRPHFLSLDRNLRGPAAQLASEGISDITYEDGFDRGENGEEIPAAVQFDRFHESLKAALASDRETIVIDNATMLNELFCGEILKLNPSGKTSAPGTSPRMEIMHWGMLVQRWKQFVLRLRQAPKRVIIIGHERVEKDEIDGGLKYFLAIPGQTGDLLPAYMSDCWRCEVKESVNSTGVVKVQRMVRVVSNQRHEHLKSSLPALPTVFEASQAEISKILAQL